MTNLNKQFLKFCKGKTSKFDKVYALTYKAVFAISLATLRNRKLAERATKVTYMTVIRECGTFIDGFDAFAWIYNIARYAANALLERKTYKDIELDLTNPRCTFNGGNYETRVFVSQIMRVLDAREREIVLLKAYAGLDIKTVAQLMGEIEELVELSYGNALYALRELSS